MRPLCLSLSAFRWPALCTRLALLAAGASLLACAAPEPPPDDDEKTPMAKTVLAEAIYTDTLLSECAAVGPQLKAHANDLRTLWMDEHGKLLAGSDAQYRRSLEQQGEVRDYRGDPLALPAVRFRHHHQQRASEALKLRGRSASNQRIVCNRQLEALEPELEDTFYMDPDAERDPLIRDSLLADADPPVSTAEVPTLAQDIAREIDPGRSFRSLEQKVSENCPGGDILVLANDWPHEAYGVFCENRPDALIRCEWGECESL